MIIVIDVAETKKCYVIISVLQGKAIVAGGKPQKTRRQSEEGFAYGQCFC